MYINNVDVIFVTNLSWHLMWLQNINILCQTYVTVEKCFQPSFYFQNLSFLQQCLRGLLKVLLFLLKTNLVRTEHNC